MNSLMTRTTDVQAILAEIENIAKTVEEKFQVPCFEFLLNYALGSDRLSQGETIPRNAEAKSTASDSSALRKLGVTAEELAQLIDPDSGEILVTKLGKTKFERQRKIALLVAARHYATEGKFSIPKTELVERCKHFDAYDSSNFSKPMKETAAGGIRVFVPENGDWKVSGPGEHAVAELVRELLSGSDE